MGQKFKASIVSLLLVLGGMGQVFASPNTATGHFMVSLRIVSSCNTDNQQGQVSTHCSQATQAPQIDNSNPVLAQSNLIEGGSDDIKVKVIRVTF